MPRLKNLPDGTLLGAPFVGDVAYIRLHGRNADAWYAVNSVDSGSSDSGKNGSERYNYDYSADELTKFVPVINEAMNKGKKVHVYFNNHPCGNGAKNATLLKEMMQWSNLQMLAIQ